MLKRDIKILNISKGLVFSITYEMSDNYLTTLLLIHSNNSSIEFEQRSLKNPYDIHGFNVTWMLCDELVDIGILVEDYESFNVRYVITPLGLQIINKIKKL